MKVTRLLLPKRLIHGGVTLIASFVLNSCALNTNDEVKQNETDDNKIFFGTSWPRGSSYRLSELQAKNLHDIVEHSKLKKSFCNYPKGMMITPAADLSYFVIYGDQFYFTPPSALHDYDLTQAQQQMLDDFMKSEFGITKRWQTPTKK